MQSTARAAMVTQLTEHFLSHVEVQGLESQQSYEPQKCFNRK